MEFNIITKDDNLVVSSQQVAKVFGKQHKNVMRDIRMIQDKFKYLTSTEFEPVKKSTSTEFEPVRKKATHKTKRMKERIEKLDVEIESTFEDLFFLDMYTDKKGEQRPLYWMNRTGFMLCALTYEGILAFQLRLAYIEEFDRMANALNKGNSDNVQAINDNGRRDWVEARRRLLDGMQLRKRYANPLEDLADPLQDRGVFAVMEILGWYDLNSVRADYTLELREHFYDVGLIEFQRIVNYCYERKKLNAPYLLAVLDNMKQNQQQGGNNHKLFYISR